jgi:hypothetical protein
VQAAIGIHASDAPLEEIAREFGGATPVRRAALFTEVADVAAMLASDRASVRRQDLSTSPAAPYIDV